MARREAGRLWGGHCGPVLELVLRVRLAASSQRARKTLVKALKRVDRERGEGRVTHKNRRSSLDKN